MEPLIACASERVETALTDVFAELLGSAPSALRAEELLEAGLTALLLAEEAESVAVALLAADLMDAGVSALVADELVEAELRAASESRPLRPGPRLE